MLMLTIGFNLLEPKRQHLHMGLSMRCTGYLPIIGESKVRILDYVWRHHGQIETNQYSSRYSCVLISKTEKSLILLGLYKPCKDNLQKRLPSEISRFLAFSIQFPSPLRRFIRQTLIIHLAFIWPFKPRSNYLIFCFCKESFIWQKSASLIFVQFSPQKVNSAI